MKWIKTGKEVKDTGESTVYYKSNDGQFEIQSRKKAIPHANGIGHWMHTTYSLIHDGKEEEYDLLFRAKEAAENLSRNGE